MTIPNSKEAGLIKSTFAKILPRREEFSLRFYNRLFDVAPSVRPLFSTNMEMQREKLLATLIQVVKCAGNMEQLAGDVRALGRRHRDYGVELEHYDVLRDVLIDTLAEFLGEDFTDQTRHAWAVMYDHIADVMKSGHNG